MNENTDYNEIKCNCGCNNIIMKQYTTDRTNNENDYFHHCKRCGTLLHSYNKEIKKELNK